jgi:hypothetical protein
MNVFNAAIRPTRGLTDHTKPDWIGERKSGAVGLGTPSGAPLSESRDHVKGVLPSSSIAQ